MTENDVNPPINNNPMEKRNEFIDHPSYVLWFISTVFLVQEFTTKFYIKVSQMGISQQLLIRKRS